MPAEHHVDQRPLDALAGAVARSGTAALDASHELLAHYGDTGAASTQRAVDTLIVQAADALRSITDTLADTSGELQSTAPSATTFEARTVRRAATDGTGTRPRPGREHGA